MADSEPNKDQSAEQLRAQAEALLLQARTQLADIQRALGAVVGDSALQSRLAALAAQISSAIGALSQALHSSGFALRQVDLTALESIVHSSETTALVAEATAKAGVSAVQMQALAAASAATRQEAQNLSRDLFERRIFDPYLHFGSAEDEADYRAREAERQRLIAGDLAHHTPDGDLRAAIREAGQMADAGSHGASASPDFGPHWRQLVEAIHRHRAAMQAAGQSTEEDDLLLRTELRRSLQSLPSEQLDRIVNADDPLDAATPFLTAAQATRLETRLQAQPSLTAASGNARPAPKVDRATLAAAAVALQAGTDLSAAGLTMTGALPSADDGHGLPAQAQTGPRTAAVTPS
jgi:hypothetical protein